MKLWKVTYKVRVLDDIGGEAGDTEEYRWWKREKFVVGKNDGMDAASHVSKTAMLETFERHHWDEAGDGSEGERVEQVTPDSFFLVGLEEVSHVDQVTEYVVKSVTEKSLMSNSGRTDETYPTMENAKGL